jgi:hypothetical protein
MEEMILKPCSLWKEKLAMQHPEDLSPSDLIELNEHLSHCEKCLFIYHEYKRMRNALRGFVSIHGAPVSLPPKLIEKWKYDADINASSEDQRNDVKKADIFFDLPSIRGTYLDSRCYTLL